MAVQMNNQLPIAKQSTVISRYPFKWLLQKIVNSDIDIFSYFQMHQIFHFTAENVEFSYFFFYFILFYLLFFIFYFFFLLLTVDCI